MWHSKYINTPNEKDIVARLKAGSKTLYRIDFVSLFNHSFTLLKEISSKN